MTTIFIADTAYGSLKEKLSEKGTLITIPKCSSLYDGIKNHTDLHCHVMSNQLYVSKEISALLDRYITTNKINYITIDEPLGTHYPDTVLLNAVSTNKYYIHNLKHSSKHLIKGADNLNLDIISVKQGYTRCNLMPLNDHTFLTTDRGIYNAIQKYRDHYMFNDRYITNTLNTPPIVHYIENGPTLLSNHPYGFFPGTMGIVGRTLYINGDLTFHPNETTLRNLCDELHLDIIDVPNQPLIDIGSIIAFEGDKTL